jgi:hypothetical protein
MGASRHDYTSRPLRANIRWWVVASAATFVLVATGWTSMGARGAASPSGATDHDDAAAAAADQSVERASPRTPATRSRAQRRRDPRPKASGPSAQAQHVLESEAQHRARAASDLINVLRAKVAEAERASPMQETPEDAANMVAGYLNGFSAALVRIAPDMVDELASEVERSMCSPTTGAAEAITLSRLLRDMPELTNPEAIDCVVRDRPEDIVLWSVLDAWNAAQLPKSEAIARVEAEAKDPRTRQHFRGRNQDGDPPPPTGPTLEPETVIPASPAGTGQPRVLDSELKE